MGDVIDLDLGGRSDLELKLRASFSELARDRGYSMQRVDEVAKIVHDVLMPMCDVPIGGGTVATSAGSTEEIVAIVEAMMSLKFAKLTLEWAGNFARAAAELAYPAER
jgi:hypothetical protein